MERPLTSPNLEGLEPFSFQPDKVDKPWWHERNWAKAEEYAGKLLFVRAGQALSLQFHREKDESWYVLSGRATIRVGEEDRPPASSREAAPRRRGARCRTRSDRWSRLAGRALRARRRAAQDGRAGST